MKISNFSSSRTWATQSARSKGGTTEAPGIQALAPSGLLILLILTFGLGILHAGESLERIAVVPREELSPLLLQQAQRVLLPLTGAFVSLIKDSSLLSIIGLREFTLAARETNAFTYSTLEAYLPLAAGYLVLTLPLSMLTHTLERRFRFET